MKMSVKDSYQAGIEKVKETAQKKIDIRQKLNDSLAKLGAQGISTKDGRAA